MQDLAIYGAGGLGREVACLVKRINTISPTWNLVGFFDDGVPVGTPVSHFGKCLGGIEELNTYHNPLNVVLAFGSPRTIEIVHNKVTNPLVSFPNLVDPDLKIRDDETFSLGVGNIIQGGCSVSTNVKIGNFNLLNSDIKIGHDTIINSYNVFMPGAKIAGDVQILSNNLFGAGSFVKQGIKIGSNIVLSPLSALLMRPKDGSTYIGNPAKIFKF